MTGHIIWFVSFRFISFRFVSFRFALFRFVSVSFRTLQGLRFGTKKLINLKMLFFWVLYIHVCEKQWIWLLNLNINRLHPLVMINMLIKIYEDAHQRFCLHRVLMVKARRADWHLTSIFLPKLVSEIKHLNGNFEKDVDWLVSTNYKGMQARNKTWVNSSLRDTDVNIYIQIKCIFVHYSILYLWIFVIYTYRKVLAIEANSCWCLFFLNIAAIALRHNKTNIFLWHVNMII